MVSDRIRARLGPLISTTEPGKTLDYFLEHSMSVQPAAKSELWRELVNGRYWRALPELKKVIAQDPNYLTDSAMSDLAQIMFEEVMEGTAISGGFPKYDDTWELLLSPEYPISSWITPKHERRAINEGFWNSVHAVFDPARPYHERREPYTQMMNLLFQQQFPSLFDYAGGVQELAKLDCNQFPVCETDPFDRFRQQLYERWVITQESFVPKGSLQNARSILRAPLVIATFYCEQDFLSGIGRTLANEALTDKAFVQTPAGQTLIKTAANAALQKQDSESTDFTALDRYALSVAKRNLADASSFDDIWRKLAKERPAKLWKQVGEFVPEPLRKEFQKELAAVLADSLVEDAAFVRNLENFLLIPAPQTADLSLRTRIFNQAFEKYVVAPKQRQDMCLRWANIYARHDQLNPHPRMEGFFFGELLARREYERAKELLAVAKSYQPSQKDKFEAGVALFVESRGKIPLPKLDESRSKHPYVTLRAYAQHFNKYFR